MIIGCQALLSFFIINVSIIFLLANIIIVIIMIAIFIVIIITMIIITVIIAMIIITVIIFHLGTLGLDVLASHSSNNPTLFVDLKLIQLFQINWI